MSENFADWIGRSVVRDDAATPRLAAELCAILSPFLFEPGEANIAPTGLHWGLAPPTPAMTELGNDGAEAKGLFLPPIPLPRRMWAGGGLELFAPIRLGAKVRRPSRLADIKLRTGRSGNLYFVTVVHEIECDGSLALRERQDLVFRAADSGGAAPPPQAAIPDGDIAWRVPASPMLLFRFSAFTFNGHRIHYDLPYATETEGYPGLLVHGPLQAALLLNQAACALGRVPARFDYRCLAPLIGGGTIAVATGRDGEAATGRIADERGIVTCEATAFA